MTRVTLQVIPKIGNESIIHSTQPITSTEVEQYIMSDHEKAKLRVLLENVGLEVQHVGDLSVQVSADAKLVETIFDTELKLKKFSIGSRYTTEHYVATNPLSIPDHLISHVAAIVLPLPPEIE